MKPIDRLSDDELAALARRAADLPDAPPRLRAAAIALWRQRPQSSLRTVAAAVSRRVTALLSFDSWASGPLAAGVRSTSTDVRHLLFSAIGRDVDVRIVRAAEHFAVTGQVLGPDEAGVVELAGPPDDTADAGPLPRVVPLGALGDFELDNVRRGTYVLTLRLGEHVIVLPPIDIGEPRG